MPGVPLAVNPYVARVYAGSSSLATAILRPQQAGLAATAEQQPCPIYRKPLGTAHGRI